MNKITALTLAAALSMTSALTACGAGSTESATAETTVATTEAATDTTTAAATATAETATQATTAAATTGGGARAGGPGGADPSSVTTAAELDALVQSAYGEAGLGLHRGHEPVQDVLDAVLGITHDELHVRLDAGQNLAAVADDLGVDPQTLIDAMVESWSVAVDNVLASGEITEAQATQYLDALEAAFTFRVNWNGSDATPSFSGIA